MAEVYRTVGMYAPEPAWRHLGDVQQPDGSVASVVEKNAPPSSYAVAAALDGEEGAILRLVGLTFLRGVFILPGLWVVAKLSKAELDGLKLLMLSFGGSATITIGMLGYYLVQRKVAQWRSQTAFPVGP